MGEGEPAIRGSDGLSVEGHSELTFEAKRGPDGSPTTVKNAMFGFAPEYEIGKTTGSSNAFGQSSSPLIGCVRSLPSQPGFSASETARSRTPSSK